METEETLKRKLHTAENLHSVVKTMKALAAVSIRQFEDAVEALSEYSRTLELALQVVLRDQPQVRDPGQPRTSHQTCAIVFGSDQGMCGQLNDEVAEHASAHLDGLGLGPGEAVILSVGARMTARLEEAGHHVEENLLVPGSVQSITSSVQDTLLILDEWHRTHGVDRVDLHFGKHLSSASYRPETTNILPIDAQWLAHIEERKWPTRRLPTFRMDGKVLYSSLVEEYLFVSIYRAFAESLASENASRLASMQGAERNIEERIREFKRDFHQRRQMKITEELLDIAAGFEALTRQGPS